MKLVTLGLISASLIGVGSAEAHQGRAHHNAASNHARVYSAPVPSGAVYGSSRAQSWYSDTGWQPGTSAITQYGYGYGYGGAGQQPPVILAAPPQSVIYGQQTYQVSRSQPFGYVVDGYGRYPWTAQAVYGQGQYQGGYQGQYQGHGHSHGHHHHHGHAPAAQPVYYQSAPVHVSQPPVYVQAPPVYVQGAQVHVTPSPVHVAPPQVEVAPAQIIYDQGYFATSPEAAPPPPPPPARSPTERPYRQEPGERG